MADLTDVNTVVTIFITFDIFALRSFAFFLLHRRLINFIILKPIIISACGFPCTGCRIWITQYLSLALYSLQLVRRSGYYFLTKQVSTGVNMKGKVVRNSYL